MDIAQRVRQRTAPHVLAALAATVHTHIRLTPHPPTRRETALVAGATVPAEATDRAGREQVRSFCTRLLRC